MAHPEVERREDVEKKEREEATQMSEEQLDLIYNDAHGITNGSAFFFGEWTVRSSDAEPAQQAIREMLINYRELGGRDHPEMKSFACWRNTWGGGARWTYRWVEEYEDLTAIQSRPSKMAQRQAWLNVLKFAEPATNRTGLWRGLHQDLWHRESR